MRLTMELRIMGDSKILMAPQYGNKSDGMHGTASIEVLSIPDAVTDDEWVPFLQRVADLWLSYEDGKGARLNVRPHWAKEWSVHISLFSLNPSVFPVPVLSPVVGRETYGRHRESINMRGMPAREYLKTEAYRTQIPLFRSTLAEIGREQGWGLEDIQKRFSNELWDYMIYS